MSAPENPAAFPMQMIPEWFEGQSGMSLRDWFAGQALSYLADQRFNDNPKVIAKTVYAIADAMLAAREQKA